jgi:3',5'-cyclic-AMP phosphodiesterase
MQVEGNVTFDTAMSTAFPQPAPGEGPGPGPLKVPVEQLRGVLGVGEVNYLQGHDRLAGVDSRLA